MKLPDNIYKVLKFLCQIGLPACGALYWGLAEIWGFPYAEQILGTISVVCTFIGSLLGISSRNYWEENEIVPIEEAK